MTPRTRRLVWCTALATWSCEKGSSMYSSVYKTVAAGEGWELSRVHKNGTINRKGDDRTGPTCPERDGSGKCKTVDYAAICGALVRWGVISQKLTFHSKSLLGVAAELATHARRQAPGAWGLREAISSNCRTAQERSMAHSLGDKVSAAGDGQGLLRQHSRGDDHDRPDGQLRRP